MSVLIDQIHEVEVYVLNQVGVEEGEFRVLKINQLLVQGKGAVFSKFPAFVLFDQVVLKGVELDLVFQVAYFLKQLFISKRPIGFQLIEGLLKGMTAVSQSFKHVFNHYNEYFLIVMEGLESGLFRFQIPHALRSEENSRQSPMTAVF